MGGPQKNEKSSDKANFGGVVVVVVVVAVVGLGSGWEPEDCCIREEKIIEKSIAVNYEKVIRSSVD